MLPPLLSSLLLKKMSSPRLSLLLQSRPSPRSVFSVSHAIKRRDAFCFSLFRVALPNCFKFNKYINRLPKRIIVGPGIQKLSQILPSKKTHIHEKCDNRNSFRAKKKRRRRKRNKSQFLRLFRVNFTTLVLYFRIHERLTKTASES